MTMTNETVDYLIGLNKSIDGANSNQQFVDAIIDFAKIINVKTIIKVNSLLL